eukprot:gene4399-4987_t
MKMLMFQKLHSLLVLAIVCCSIQKASAATMTMSLTCDENTSKKVSPQPVCSFSNKTITGLIAQMKNLIKEVQLLKEEVKNCQIPLGKSVNKSVNKSVKKSVNETVHGLPGDKSCKQIKADNSAAKSGRYWVNLDKPREVYCDMETNGGGWMLVSNIVSETTNGRAWSQSNSIATVSKYPSKAFGLSPSGLRSLQDLIHFDQLRFFCHKKSPGRTIDIATKKNNAGKAVVRYFTARTNAFPTACGSYSKMADDNSMLSQNCNDWGKDGAYKVNKWGLLGVGNTRLYDHPAFVYHKYHWIVPFTTGGRWECDDYYKTSSKQVSVGDAWKIFIR